MAMLRSMNPTTIDDIPIEPGEECTMVIGRHPDCDKVVANCNNQISGKHFTITVSEDEGVQIKDLSTHGTWVNGQRLPSKKFKGKFPGRDLSMHGFLCLFPDDQIVLCAATVKKAKKQLEDSRPGRKRKAAESEVEGWVALEYIDPNRPKVAQPQITEDPIPFGDDEPEAAPPPLPPGWSKLVSRSSGKVYYRNEHTKVTRWDPPPSSAVEDGAVVKVPEWQRLKSEEEIEVPQNVVGRIIGKAGSTIAELQLKSGANIKIDQKKSAGLAQQKVAISGTPEAVRKAKSLILLLTGAGDDEAEKRVLSVPQAVVGLIVGKAGASIKAIQEETGAKVQIDQAGPEGQPRNVTITGTSQAVAKAKSRIEEMTGISSKIDVEQEDASASIQSVVRAPPEVVGRIIGKSGKTIISIEEASGAKVRIDQTGPEGQPRNVTISGTPEAVAKAKSRIEDVTQLSIDQDGLLVESSTSDVQQGDSKTSLADVGEMPPPPPPLLFMHPTLGAMVPPPPPLPGITPRGSMVVPPPLSGCAAQSPQLIVPRGAMAGRTVPGGATITGAVQASMMNALDSLSSRVQSFLGPTGMLPQQTSPILPQQHFTYSPQQHSVMPSQQHTPFLSKPGAVPANKYAATAMAQTNAPSSSRPAMRPSQNVFHQKHMAPRIVSASSQPAHVIPSRAPLVPPVGIPPPPGPQTSNLMAARIVQRYQMHHSRGGQSWNKGKSFQ